MLEVGVEDFHSLGGVNVNPATSTACPKREERQKLRSIGKNVFLFTVSEGFTWLAEKVIFL
jgi:hypothetical protein